MKIRKEIWTFMDDVGNDINHDVGDVICDIISFGSDQFDK
jgi:hypothetical protein